MYQATKICIPKSHSTGRFLNDCCLDATDLKNRTMFIIRQLFTGLAKDEPSENERTVIDAVRTALPEMNSLTGKTYKMPTAEKRVPSYSFLDAFFKVTEEPAYRKLPAHTAQNAVKDVCEQWKSFFGLCRAFKKGDIPARPGLPGYIRKGTPSAVTFSNQQCRVIQKNPDGRKVTKANPAAEGAQYFLQFADGIDYPLGRKGKEVAGFKEVTCIVQEDRIQLSIVTEKDEPGLGPDNGRLAGLDLGIDNLATLADNTGGRPLIFDGKWLKSFNRYINKKIAGLMSKLSAKGLHTSKQVRRLWQKRADIIRMYYQRVNNLIVAYLKDHDINTIIAGRNKGWKQDINMGHANNQKFAYIPHAKMLADLKFKCQMNGIIYIETEESYTSKASLFDSDVLPECVQETEEPVFSGRRVFRGLYRTAEGIIVNADVNGAGNILRKVYANAFDGIDKKKLLNPIKIRIQTA